FVCNTQQRIVNRLHLIFLVLMLYLIFLFSAFKPKSVTLQIIKPSLLNYKDVLKDYSYSLQCSCSQISIRYETFLYIELHFHDLCSSQFISDEWIHYIYGEGNLSRRFSFDDYRYSAPGQFLYFLHFLLSENLLIQEIEIILNRLQLTASKSFLNLFNVIREIIGSNMI
ncbi:unnamed protein product, partial [Rotaria sp. Silwood2]